LVFLLPIVFCRNVVVTPRRAFKIVGLILLVLVCPHPGIVEPGVCELIRQTALSLLEVVDRTAEVGAAPTTDGNGAGSVKGHLLTALAL
jgi:hypothetical protein